MRLATPLLAAVLTLRHRRGRGRPVKLIPNTLEAMPEVLEEGTRHPVMRGGWKYVDIDEQAAAAGRS